MYCGIPLIKNAALYFRVKCIFENMKKETDIDKNLQKNGVTEFFIKQNLNYLLGGIKSQEFLKSTPK